jgi:hypothetical protein
MPKNSRRRTPPSVEEEILFRSDHTCCICRLKGKDVQIHHIDGNKANNHTDNLAVVCLDCHSKVTGSRGLGKAYKPGEVRRYKRAWEKQVADYRKTHRPRIYYKRELVSQIDFTICEILASKSNDPKAEQLLDTLYELHLWRGGPEIDKKIVDGLSHLALMSGLSSPRLASLVADKLWQMCWHFVGPKEVPMDKRDLKYVLDCIDALDTLGKFNCEFGHGKKASESFAQSAENFFEIGLWYEKKPIKNAILKSYKNSLESCRTDGKLEFSYGRAVLKKSLGRLELLMKDYAKTWSHHRRRMAALQKL